MMAEDLKALNESRKEMTEKGVERAVEMIETSALKEDRVLVVYLPDCHESLAGIIAGRIRETYNKPVIVLTKGKDGVLLALETPPRALALALACIYSSKNTVLFHISMYARGTKPS